MHDKSDMDLLQEYRADGSEEAFATIVRRHINLVYSAALRMSQDRDVADDVTQAVFVVLSRKARSLSPKTVLAGWLYRAARFAAADALKSKHRRQQREQEAAMIETGPDSTWDEIAPHLDEALSGLGAKDRNAVLLRYFQNKSLKEVGLELGVSDDTAQKRIARGLEKLRRLLTRRNVAITTGGLTAMLSASAAQAAPAQFVDAMCAIATSGASLTTSTAAIVKGTLHMFTLIQLKNAALIALALLITGGAATLVAQRTETKSTASAPGTPIEALAVLAEAVKVHDANAFAAVVHGETPAGTALVSSTLPS